MNIISTLCSRCLVFSWRLVIFSVLTSGQEAFGQIGDLITSARVRLRTDSSMNAPVLRILTRSEVVFSNGAESDVTGFAPVRTSDGQSGWVFGEYLRPNPSVESLVALRSTCGVQCGTQRWPVKTVTDEDAGEVNLEPVEASVEELIAFDAPEHKPKNRRVEPVEKTTYKIDGRLIGWVKEDDEDLHVVLASKQTLSKTLILEVPDSDCKMACSSTHSETFRQIRDTLVEELGAPSSTFRKLTPPRRVTVTGIGFFDFIHNQNGVAPNGIELHPLLAIEFGR